MIVDGILISCAPAGLTEYTIPDSVTEIGWAAFGVCSSLTSITIPESVLFIDGNAFWGCSGLMSIFCMPITPPAIYADEGYSYGEGIPFPLNSGMKIYVPREAYNDYMKYSRIKEGWIDQTNWSIYRFRSYIEPYDFE